MPKLNDENMEIAKITGTSFQYSATKLDNLGATEYTLVTMVIDVSSSVAAYKNELEACIKEIVASCRRSPRADNLMLRFITFSNSSNEEHGFKLLTECNPNDYDNSLTLGGMTALFDGSTYGIKTTSHYAKQLTQNDFGVNGIVFVMSDGDDNRSAGSAFEVALAKEECMKEETMESMLTVLIGVNLNAGLDNYLQDFQNNGKFDAYVKINDANEKTLAKLAQFVSKSISSQSQSLGTGISAQVQSLTI